MKLIRSSIMALLLGLQTMAFGQAQEISFSSSQWRFGNDKHRIETYKGKECLYMEPGFTVYEGLQFKNGIIEYDVSFANTRQFSGVVFRRENDTNYEEVYLRPHQSGKVDANQYTPVFNGLSGWQLYHGEGHGAPYSYKFDEWMHVKLIVLEERMEVYIDDMEKPLIYVPQLKRATRAGEIGFTTNRSFVRLANLKVMPSDAVELKTAETKLPTPEPGTITSWQISEVVTPADFIKEAEKNQVDLSALKWKAHGVEYTGTLNLARVWARTKEKNAVVAKFKLNANSERIQAFHFGYSDKVHVFCNGRLLYAGDNTYRTRDYRHLGTIGYFDTVFLPLQEGQNEIWLLVTEAFGGWGVKGKLGDMDGLNIVP